MNRTRRFSTVAEALAAHEGIDMNYGSAGTTGWLGRDAPAGRAQTVRTQDPIVIVSCAPAAATRSGAVPAEERRPELVMPPPRVPA